MFDTIVSQETLRLLNTGYAALFETARTGRSYYGRLSKEGAQSGMFFEVGYQFRKNVKFQKVMSINHQPKEGQKLSHIGL